LLLPLFGHCHWFSTFQILLLAERRLVHTSQSSAALTILSFRWLAKRFVLFAHKWSDRNGQRQSRWKSEIAQDPSRNGYGALM
jgi:hypothetical protein